MIALDEQDAPVGQVRLDATAVPGTFVVSLILAPEARGRRFASAVLHAVEPAARAHGATRLTALIRPGNDASVRAFKAAGYYAFTERKGPRGDELHCERRVTPFA
jgi:RimJ/RimL family protein N-acetyltransferase